MLIYTDKLLFLFLNVFFDGKAEFSESLLQSSISHDPSKIILICWWWTFLIVINVESSCAAYFFFFYE